MAFSSGIRIEGLAEFRRAIRTAAARTPTELSLALKRAGTPIVAQAAANAPRLTGRLASGYGVSVRGTKASIVSRVPYAGGAEWGERGRWAGFNKYGATPRTVWPAIEAQANTVMLIVEYELRNIVEAYGWLR